MERCDHGHIEWCPKCDEDLRKFAEKRYKEAKKHILHLETKIRAQKKEIEHNHETLKLRSKALDAMWWVWCDGGCPTGTNRYKQLPELTEEIVKLAERNVSRLRKWYNNTEFRKTYNELKEKVECSDSLVLWYLCHLERGTLDKVLEMPGQPRKLELIEEARRLYDKLHK